MGTYTLGVDQGTAATKAVLVVRAGAIAAVSRHSLPGSRLGEMPFSTQRDRRSSPGLQVLDVSDPSHPVYLGSYDPAGSGQGNEISGSSGFSHFGGLALAFACSSRTR